MTQRRAITRAVSSLSRSTLILVLAGLLSCWFSSYYWAVSAVEQQQQQQQQQQQHEVGACLEVEADGEEQQRDPQPSTTRDTGGGEIVDVCVIGAGAGGVQLGHYLNMMVKQRVFKNYVVIERNDRAGEFFDKFPIHRELISITKRHTGRNNTEFNLRHDWNVLLDNHDVAPMTERTKRRYPDASLLASYIREFAEPQTQQETIRYNTRVVKILRHEGSAFENSAFDGQGFDVVVVTSTEHDSGQQAADPVSTTTLACGVVVVASGIDVQSSPTIEGFDRLSINYDSLPPTGESFEGKRVAILGLGNAAFETATALEDYASYVHLFYGRHDYLSSNEKWPHVSWETRYVGSVRAARVKPWDAYLLKSLDGYVSSNLRAGAMLRECYSGARQAKCFFFKQPGFAKGTDDTFIQAGLVETGDTASSSYLKLLHRHQVHFETRTCDGSLESSSTLTFDTVSKQTTKWQTECVNLNNGALSYVVVNVSTIPDDEVAGAIHDYRHESVPGRKSNEAICCSAYDEVISAIGWFHDLSMYDPRTKPLMQANRKYPLQSHEYESLNVPGMFFAGSLTHGRDWRRGAGGFVHGFRYTAKALARILAVKFGNTAFGVDPGDSRLMHDSSVLHKVLPLPSHRWNGNPLVVDLTSATLEGAVELLSENVLARIAEASSPYQMTCNFGDGIVLEDVTATAGGAQQQRNQQRSFRAVVVEDMPLSYLNGNLCQDKHCFFWTFCFNSRPQYQTLHASLSHGTGFGPALLYYHPADKQDSKSANHMPASRPRDAIDMGESITTTWVGKGYTATVQTFLRRNILPLLQPDAPLPPLEFQETATFRNLTVLVWVVNDLNTTTGPVDVVGPGTHDKGNAVESARGLNNNVEILAGTVLPGLPDHSPALLFHSSVPPGRHSQLVETYDGAVWRVVANELVSVPSGSGQTRLERRTIFREWTVNFANGPWQEFHLSEITPVAHNACIEARGCGDYAGECDSLQSELDKINVLSRGGHFSTTLHINGHEERSSGQVCPCTCSAREDSPPVSADSELQSAIDELTAAMQATDADRSSLEKQLARLQVAKQKAEIYQQLKDAALLGEETRRKELNKTFYDLAAITQQSNQVTSVSTLREEIFQGRLLHDDALLKKKQLQALLRAARHAARATNPLGSKDWWKAAESLEIDSRIVEVRDGPTLQRRFEALFSHKLQRM